MNDMELQRAHLVQNLGMNMEFGRCNSRSSNSPKVERKVIEKNRRNHMKNLYSKLNSLLPHHTSKEPLPLPEQIDEAVNYIKSLETRLKEAREKRESLTGRKRSHRCINGSNSEAETTIANLISPEIRIDEKGSAIEVVLMTGQETQFMFYEMIRILHQERAEVVNANFSVVGNTIFHMVHAEIEPHMYTFGATKIKEKLNRFVRGSSSEQQLQELWDYEIHPQTWDFSIM